MLIDESVHPARAIILESDRSQEVATEQAHMRTSELRNRRNRNHIGQEPDDVRGAIARTDVDLEAVDGAVQISGDPADSLVAERLQGEELRDSVLDDGDLGTGVDHHLMRNRLPVRAFIRQKLDICRVWCEDDLDERPMLYELASHESDRLRRR